MRPGLEFDLLPQKFRRRVVGIDNARIHTFRVPGIHRQQVMNLHFQKIFARIFRHFIGKNVAYAVIDRQKPRVGRNADCGRGKALTYRIHLPSVPARIGQCGSVDNFFPVFVDHERVNIVIIALRSLKKPGHGSAAPLNILLFHKKAPKFPKLFNYIISRAKSVCQ